MALSNPPQRKYYALLVGINDYPNPFSHLNGCIKDIDNIEAYLEEWIHAQVENPASSKTSFSEGISIKHLGPLQILRLANEQATYANINKAFQEFLSQAKTHTDAAGNIGEDVVWFHFSGHGSEEFTAEEFLELEPNGKDQTIVCYNETYGTGQTHMADKEIAVLLHDIATKDDTGNPKEVPPHIVVSLDCCHSGSGTRFMEFDLKTRNADVLPASTRDEAKKRNLPFRAITSYANGYYQQQLERNMRLEVPLAPHVLLSACESVQLAGDLSEGGVFSLGLLEALKRSKHNINYSDLYMQARSSVQKIRKKDQTPTFEVLGGFNAYRRFMEGSPLGQADQYPISFEAGQWKIGCGAIHGIPIKSDKPVLIDILYESKSIGIAELTAIGAQKSHFKLPENIELDPSSYYTAQLHFLPLPPVPVWIHGESNGIDQLKKHWDNRKNIIWIESLEDIGEVSLEVKVESDVFRLTDRKVGKQVFSWKNDEAGAKVIIDSLAKIVNWERTINLNHEKSAILSKNWIDFEIKVKGSKPDFLPPIRKSQHEFIATEEQFYSKDGALFAGFIPEWTVRNCKQDLYAYLFHLRSNYCIESYEGEVVYRPDEHRAKEKVIFPLLKKNKAWGLSANEPETTSYFKLIVCTEPLDYQQLQQSGLGGDRLMNFKARPMAVKNDWCSITYKVTLKRA